MGLKPFGEDTTLRESSNNEPLSLTPSPSQILMETSNPSTLSRSASFSDLQETILVEHEIGDFNIQDDGKGDATVSFYPSPDDIMPYDHALPDFIRQITNQSNLENLQSLKIRVISACVSLHRMSAYLVNLKELDLEGSILNSLRDIGCNFKNLRILKVGRCQLESLDGTFGLSSLRELYAEKNFINDVTPCSNLPHIKHIDVSWNRIRNISYAGFLSVCTKLKSIIFTGNPATEVPDYRQNVRRILPQLEILDGVPFSNGDIEKQEEFTELAENCKFSKSESLEKISDLHSISSTDSMDEFTSSNKNILEKKTAEAKLVFNENVSDPSDVDVSCTFSSQKIRENQDSLKGSSLPKNYTDCLDRPKATKTGEDKNINVNQKCISIKKIDKDANYRPKMKFFPQSKYDTDLVSLPEIVHSLGSSHSSFQTPSSLLQSTESARYFSESDHRKLSPEPDKSKMQKEVNRTVLEAVNAIQIESHDDGNIGAIKKKYVASSVLPSPTTNSVPIISEKINVINKLGVSSLTSGSPIRGNLTAALRSRNKSQNKDLIKSALKSFRCQDVSLQKLKGNNLENSNSALNCDNNFQNDMEYFEELLLSEQKLE